MYDGIVEEFGQAVNAYLFVIGIGIDCTELLCDLNQLPFVDCRALKGKLENSANRLRIYRPYHFHDVGRADSARESEHDSVCSDLYPHRTSETCGKKNRDNASESLVSFVTAADV